MKVLDAANSDTTDIVPVDSRQLAIRSASMARRGLSLLRDLSYSPLTRLRIPSMIDVENAGQLDELARWGKGRISQMVFSPSGETLAVGTSTSIHLYDTSTPRLRVVLDSDTFITAVDVSPDGEILASADSDGIIQIWQLAENGVQLETPPFVACTLTGHTGTVNSVRFSVDGRLLASASDDGTIRLWDVNGSWESDEWGGLACILQDSDTRLMFRDLVFSPDGSTIAAACGAHQWGQHGTIQIWRTIDGAHLGSLNGHKGPVERVVFSPDGQYLASASLDRTVKIWRNADGALFHTMDLHRTGVLHVTFSPDGSFLVSASQDGELLLTDIEQSAQTVMLEPHTGGMRAMACCLPNNILASAGVDGTLWLRRLPSGTDQAQISEDILLISDEFAPSVESVMFSAQGDRVGTGSTHGLVQLWRAWDGRLLDTYAGSDEVVDVAFSPDGQHLAAAFRQHIPGLWQTQTGEQQQIQGPSGPWTNISFSPDGSQLAATSQIGAVWIWQMDEMPDSVPAHLLSQYPKAVWSARFSHDWRLLATACYDNTVQIWQFYEEELLYSLEGHSASASCVAFSCDKSLLASGSHDETIILWRIGDGSRLYSLKGHRGAITCLGFSPSNEILASGGTDGTIRLWDLSDGSLLVTLAEHTGAVTCLDFSPDGGSLISGSGDGTVRVWGIPLI